MEDVEITAGGRLLAITEAAVRARGAELCFGEPVREGDRMVVPVASVSASGGLGFGSARGDTPGDGGGLGGMFGARPVGFIVLTGDKTWFKRILTAADVAQVMFAFAFGAAMILRAVRHVVSKHP